MTEEIKTTKNYSIEFFGDIMFNNYFAEINYKPINSIQNGVHILF